MKKLQKSKHNFIWFLILFLTLVSTGVKDNAFLSPMFMTAARAAFSTPAQQESQTSSQPQVAAENTLEKTAKTTAKKEEKSGFQQSLFRFFMAMIGVLVSSFAIFLGLKFYQKFILKKGSTSDDQDFNTLESPKDFKEAINLFLNKTDK